MMTRDRPLLGMTLMLGFCILAPLGDALAKLLGETIPIGQLVTARFAVQALLLIPIVYLSGLPWRLRGRVLWLTVLRTILHILGIGAMFTALQYLPLADAIAIAFVMPFIMLLLGKFVLHEEVGPGRLVACAAGFAGTLLVIQPSFAEVGWPALLPLGVAVSFAFYMLITRQIAKAGDPIALQAVSGALATLALVPLLWVFRDHDITVLHIVAPSVKEAWLLLAIGLVGTLAHLLMTWSLRFAPSATLAPMQYLEIPVATVVGFVIFRDLPDGLAALGILVTVGAGLYIIQRERTTARALAAMPVARPPAGTSAE